MSALERDLVVIGSQGPGRSTADRLRGAVGAGFRAIERDDVPELACLLDRIEETYHPLAVFLYGSRARGDATPDSDWDLKVVVADDCPDALLSPWIGWAVQEESGVHADVSCTRLSDFEADLMVPNSAAREVLRDGARIGVR